MSREVIRFGEDLLKSSRFWMIIVTLVMISSIIMASVESISYLNKQIKNDQLVYELNNPGGRCLDILQNDRYPSLLFECDIILTERPDFSNGLIGSQSFFQSRFNTTEEMISMYCEPKKINYEWSHVFFSGTPRVLHLDDLNEIAKKYRDHQSDNGVFVIHINFINGYYSPDQDQMLPGDEYIGVTINADTIFIFSPYATGSSDRGLYPFLNRDIAHELGHLMGLVAPFTSSTNLNAPNASKHLDTQHHLHCSTQNCIMNYSSNPWKGNLPCKYCIDDLTYLRNANITKRDILDPIFNWSVVMLSGCIGVIGMIMIYKLKKSTHK